jgi:hypothetical protein
MGIHAEHRNYDDVPTRRKERQFFSEDMYLHSFWASFAVDADFARNGIKG